MERSVGSRVLQLRSNRSQLYFVAHDPHIIITCSGRGGICHLALYLYLFGVYMQKVTLPTKFHTSIETTIKLKDEAGMAGSKSTQTRFVYLSYPLYTPTLVFLDTKYHARLIQHVSVAIL